MYRNQAEEIKTIKPRPFNIPLSDADTERLYMKAYENGITPEQLLADYIGDLITGTYTRGSDERMYADQYFNRCCYELGLQRNFLEWALYMGLYENVADEIEALEDAIADLQLLEEEKDSLTPEDYNGQFSSLQDFKKGCEEALADYYQDYKDYKAKAKEEPQELQEGIETVKAFTKAMKEAIEGK